MINALQKTTRPNISQLSSLKKSVPRRFFHFFILNRWVKKMHRMLNAGEEKKLLNLFALLDLLSYFTPAWGRLDKSRSK